MIKRIFNTPLKKGFAAVSAATMISRILGMVRDIFMAKYFGTSMFADAFYVAFRIPNLLRRLLGEGALPAALIPVYSEMLVKKEDERAKRLTGSMFSFLFVICFFLTAVGVIFTPQIVRLIAPGFFGNTEQFALTVTLARIMFPILILVTMATIAMGICNARKYFFIPAVAPALFNVSAIVFFMFFTRGIPGYDIRGLAVFAVIGFFLHFALMLPILFREKVASFCFFVKGVFSNADVKRIIVRLIPVAMGVSVMQLNIFVDTICATLMGAGVVSALYFANRLYQLPLALFGVSISMVSLPFMSDARAEKKTGAVAKNLFDSFAASLFLIIPSTLGLIILAGETVSLLFERGLFSSGSTAMTSAALVFYSAGLAAFAGIRIFANYFYSKKDMRTPVKIAVLSFIVNIAGDIAALVFHLGPGGLAGATSIAALTNFALLVWLVIKDGIRPPTSFYRKLSVILAASAIMAGFLLAPFQMHTLIKIALAGGIYLISARAFRSFF
ncbi:murein biosynthesis integral membrane protein MurJ [bacterium]|nr:murein biosynthesis integral membrane protein MurJ [Candidatus Omnitrophota bacterium]MBU2528135.1 murein biosynthesis integral membrane protein MurJ [bacterium]MBU3929513.1 murein biosynthesis integral membrane protein MurJ [bacterium]MBU4123124.1 murein biosynthesis integral membrane protein MurJ [bacterium]